MLKFRNICMYYAILLKIMIINEKSVDDTKRNFHYIIRLIREILIDHERISFLFSHAKNLETFMSSITIGSKDVPQTPYTIHRLCLPLLKALVTYGNSRIYETPGVYTGSFAIYAV